MIGARFLRGAAVVAAIALPLGLAAASPASAAPAPKTGTVSVLHGIPASVLEKLGVPGGLVDVCSAGATDPLINDFAPGQLVTAKLPPNTYMLSVHPGAGGCAGPTLLSASATVVAGKNYTITANLALTGSTDPAKAIAPALNVFENNQAALGKTKKQAMKNGQGRVTVRHIAAAPGVDVFVNGNVAIANLTNPNQAQAVLKKGTYQVAAGLTGAGTAGIALGPVPLQVRQGWNVIVYAWGVPQSVGGEGVQVAVQYVKLNLPKK
jgi:hypothetical protein